jgi:hypothetical protein
MRLGLNFSGAMATTVCLIASITLLQGFILGQEPSEETKQSLFYSQTLALQAFGSHRNILARSADEPHPQAGAWRNKLHHYFEERSRETRRQQRFIIAETSLPFPDTEPASFEDLFNDRGPWRLTFSLIQNKRYLYSPHDAIAPFGISALRHFATASNISEQRLIHAFVVIEKTKRRMPFLNSPRAFRVPGYMRNQFTIHVRSRTGAVEINLGSKVFIRMLLNPHSDDVLMGALGHDAGHSASANGWVERTKEGRSLGNPYVGDGIQEIMADTFARALVGEISYSHYLLHEVSSLQMTFARESLGSAELNMLAYFIALLDSVIPTPDVLQNIATIEESVRSEGSFQFATLQRLRNDYKNIIAACAVNPKTILPPATLLKSA